MTPSIHPSLFLLFLALKSCVSLALSKGGYFHPASPPQQCSTTSPLLSLSLTGHHRVHCISCLVRPPGWMISGPVGTRSGHRPSAPVASDSRALNLQIMLTINNAPPSLLRSIRSRGAFYRTPVWTRAATKRSRCWRGNKACACLGAALRSRASDAHNLLFLEQFCIAGNMDGWGMIHWIPPPQFLTVRTYTDLWYCRCLWGKMHGFWNLDAVLTCYSYISTSSGSLSSFEWTEVWCSGAHFSESQQPTAYTPL